MRTAVDDGTDTAKLMNYFKSADPADISQGDLSKRIRFLKCEEGGYEVMCQITEMLVQEGIEIGVQEGIEIGVQEGIEIGVQKKAKETTLNLTKRGMSIEAIAEIVNESVTLVKQWLEGAALEK